MSDNVTFTRLRYADLLGKPLTKSLYRQLPCLDKSLIDMNDTEYVWGYTIHGKVNWCPPHCTVDTRCNCDGYCKRLSRCKQMLPHQHLLIGTDGTLSQSFILTHMTLEDEYPFTGALFRRYEPLSHQEQKLEKMQLENRENYSLTKRVTLTSEERVAAEKHIKETAVQLATCKKELSSINYLALSNVTQWLRAALDALPVVLLRG